MKRGIFVIIGKFIKLGNELNRRLRSFLNTRLFAISLVGVVTFDLMRLQSQNSFDAVNPQLVATPLLRSPLITATLLIPSVIKSPTIIFLSEKPGNPATPLSSADFHASLLAIVTGLLYIKKRSTMQTYNGNRVTSPYDDVVRADGVVVDSALLQVNDGVD